MQSSKSAGSVAWLLLENLRAICLICAGDCRIWLDRMGTVLNTTKSAQWNNLHTNLMNILFWKRTFYALS